MIVFVADRTQAPYMASLHRTRLAAAVVALSSGLSACTTSSATEPPATGGGPVEPTSPPAVAPEVMLPAAGEPQLTSLSLSIGELVPSFDAAMTDYTLTANGSFVPIDVSAAASAGTTVLVNGNAATTVQLAPREDLVVTAVAAGGGTRRYTIHYLPPTFPSYQVATLDAAKVGTENVLLTPDNRWLLVTNRAGDPLYYRALAPLQVTDFKPQRASGVNAAYSFETTDGNIHLLDDHLRELKTMTLLPNRDHAGLPADIHDFLVLGEEHYMVEAYVRISEDMAAFDDEWQDDAPVIAAVVQEVDHGSVVFEWWSTDVPSLYSDSTDMNAFTASADSDYVHLNSLAIDPVDGALIVSLRHADEVLKIDRTTGKTLWTLGGKSDDFSLTTDQRFSHQHHASRLSDGTVLLFDNPTRVLTFALDEAEKKVTSFNVLATRDAAWTDSTYMGSVYRMDPTRYLIGWGGRTDTSKLGASVSEIVDGAAVWSLTFDSNAVFSYRAHPLAL
jgi:hypothetical protein